MSGRMRMSSNSQVARVRKDVHAETLESAGQLGPEPIQAGHGSTRLGTDQTRVTYLSVDQKRPAATIAENSNLSPLYGFTKRAFDLIVGLGLLVVATPIILIAAAAIRLESKGSP